MGPRSFDRGKVSRRALRSSGQHSCFNGAAIFRSRKGTRTRTVTAVESGISRLQWGRDLSIAESRVERIGQTLPLQWGRDLSIAKDPMGARRRTGSLQWGRDLSIAERLAAKGPLNRLRRLRFNGAAIFRSRKASSILAAVIHRHAGPASMGPRSFDRGKIGHRAPLDSFDALNASASMGPRSFDRGKVVFMVRYMISVRFRSASMGPRSFDRGKDRFDQRSNFRSSRDLSIAADGERSCCSFNGAAIFRSRKANRYALFSGTVPASRFNGAAIFRSRKERAL